MTPNRRVAWQATSNDENSFLATLGGAAAYLAFCDPGVEPVRRSERNLM
jgi:hypothetical protein